MFGFKPLCSLEELMAKKGQAPSSWVEDLLLVEWNWVCPEVKHIRFCATNLSFRVVIRATI